jgi:hypothetical protein
MRSLACILTILFCASFAFGQNKPDKSPDKTTNKQASKFPQFDGLKPRVEMQQALKKAEKFIKKEKINTKDYYLAKANLIQYGAVKDKAIVWYFRWVNADGTVGDYIEIAVFMDGSVKHI